MNWYLLALVVGVVAVVSFVLGLIARFVTFPLELTGNAFFRFTNTLLLFCITFLILEFRSRREG